MEITKQQAISDLEKIFNTTSWKDRVNGRSFADKGDFFIDKREYTRPSVIEKLQAYFKDKTIIDGQCRLEGITLLWTTFHIEDRNTNI